MTTDVQEIVKTILMLSTVPLVTACTSYLKLKSWSSETKKLGAFGFSVLFALVPAVIDGRFDIGNIGGTTMLLFYASRAFYDQYFGATQFNRTLEAMGEPHDDKLP